jgi:peptidoglycan-N-acetylglucosamine deacetylase
VTPCPLPGASSGLKVGVEIGMVNDARPTPEHDESEDESVTRWTPTPAFAVAVLVTALAWSVTSAGQAIAQQPAAVSPSQAECLSGTKALGLSRIVEVDTSSGPRFGFQYKENGFLEEGEVVLTFDDGPLRKYSKPILDALDRHCVKATFFTVGRMAIADPKTLKDMYDRGHTIASHTWSHQKLGRLSRNAAKREIELGISAVRAALGKPITPFFRFPYLSDPKSAQEYVQSRGMGIFGIDVDSKDFRTRSGDRMRQTVLRALKREGKGIILFHDIQRSTVAGLSGLLDDLKARNYKVVHMVSKQDVETDPKYDAIANRMMTKKWGGSASKTNPKKPADGSDGSTVTAATETEKDDLPWQKKQVVAPPRNAAPERKRPKPASSYGTEDRWQLRSQGW